MINKEIIESALLDLIQEEQFYGTLLQEVNFKISRRYPTAALLYDKKQQKFEIHINYEFMSNLERKSRASIFHHEILHFTHKHLQRFESQHLPKEDMKLYNVAADASINQLLKHLPDGCIDITKLKMKDGKPFPLKESAETYFKLMKEDPEHYIKQLGLEYGPGMGNIDAHEWENLTEEEARDMLEEMGRMIRRTIEKTSYAHSNLPGGIQDLLEDINNKINGMNYKQILKTCIKRKLLGFDRTHSWTRESKRFGVYAPGTTTDRIPELGIFVDTSGSISHNEMSEFLQTIDGFLKVGAKKCTLGLWHTALYKITKYRRAQDLNSLGIEGGGTDVTPVLEYVHEKNPNLTLILTDGYYSSGFTKKITGDIIFIISKNGTMDHPYKHIGKTIQIK